MNMLLVLEPLVQATLGNTNFSPYSVLVVAVLMLINLELPFSHIRSALLAGTACMVLLACQPVARAIVRGVAILLNNHMWSTDIQ